MKQGIEDIYMNKNDLKRWGRSLLIAGIVFLILSVYLFLRRGYYNMYIINKVFGSTAVVLAGMTLFVGPLRKIPLAASLMTIRRHLGLLAFGLALSHIIASLYQTNRFEWFSWYLEEWIPVVFGLAAIAVWVYMTYISQNKKIQAMGVTVWKHHLSLAGKVAFLAIFLHLTIMKYEGWLRWWNGQVKQTPQLANPEYPPASLFIFVGMLIVIVSRIFVVLLQRNFSSYRESRIEGVKK